MIICANTRVRKCASARMRDACALVVTVPIQCGKYDGETKKYGWLDFCATHVLNYSLRADLPDLADCGEA